MILDYLAPKQAELLALLQSYEIERHEYLCMQLWGRDSQAEIDCLKVLVHSLRRKLAMLDPTIIQAPSIITRIKVGYKLVD